LRERVAKEDEFVLGHHPAVGLEVTLQGLQPPVLRLHDQVRVAPIGQRFVRRPAGHHEQCEALGEGSEILQHLVQAFGLDVLEHVRTGDEIRRFGSGRKLRNGRIVSDRPGDFPYKSTFPAAVVEQGLAAELLHQRLDLLRVLSAGSTIVDALLVKHCVLLDIRRRDEHL
jgi:hypothetical protein